METLLWIESAGSYLEWHSPRRCLGHRQVERRTLQELGTESRSVVYTLLLSCVPDWCVHSKLRCHSLLCIAPHCGIWICGLWLRELHLSVTCAGRFLSACLLSAHSEKSPLFVFSMPWDTRRTWPCTKPAGAGGGLIPPSGRPLSYASELSPLEFGWRRPLSSSWNSLLNRLE